MAWWIWCILVAGLTIVLIGIQSWALAVRIDRLHRRVVSTRLALGRTLVKRASDCLQLADSGFLEPDDSIRLDRAARKALAAQELPIVQDGLGTRQRVEEDARFFKKKSPTFTLGEDQRYVLESALTKALRESLTLQVRENLLQDSLGAVLLEEVESSGYRLKVVRSLHNQDVTQVRQLRERFLVKVLHLAGHAPLPEFVDLDDVS